MRRIRFHIVLGVCLLGLSACTPKPEPIRYGEERGAYCMMNVADERFGAELVTTKGKVYKFDSIECLAGFLLEERVAAGEVHSLWVTDFAHPPTLIRAEEALFLHSPNVHSPMGMNLAAFATREDLAAVRAEVGGEVLSWDEVLALVGRERHGHPAHDPTAMP